MFDDIVVVEVETGDAVVALGVLGLLFDADDMAVLVEFHDSEALRIVDVVAEYGRSLAGFRVLDSCFQSLFQSVACKNVVTQDHSDAVVSDELFADDKGLGQSVGTRL